MSELAVRVERVRLLLSSLNDPYPTPRGALEADSGPSPSRYVPCETCRSSGEVRVRGGWALCLVCDGTGEKRRQDEPAFDAYLGMPLEDAVRLPVAAEARPYSEADPEAAYAWERAREAHDRHGSYRELRVQLERLALVHPRRYRLVRAALVDHEGTVFSLEATREIDLGVIGIALRMRRVKVPHWLLEEAAPVATVASLAQAGLGAGAIARQLGLSKRAVRRKLRGKQVGSGQAGVPFGAT